jgi:hypothetical protein
VGGVGFPRVSPRGDRVAFLAFHPDSASVETVDLRGKRTTLSKGHVALGLAWGPDGDEVWFTEWGALYAVTLDGRERLLARFPGAVTINDVFRDKRALVTLAQHQSALMALPPGASREQDLSWFNASQVADVSRDGKAMLFSDRATAESVQTPPPTRPPTCGAPTGPPRSGSAKASRWRSRRTEDRRSRWSGAHAHG